MMLYYTPIDCLLISCGSPPSPSHSVIVHSRRRINELDGAVEDWERISRKKNRKDGHSSEFISSGPLKGWETWRAEIQL